MKKDLSPQTIRVVDEKVKPEIEKLKNGKRGPHAKLTPSQKAMIGKRAAENRVTATLCRFSGRYEGPITNFSVTKLALKVICQFFYYSKICSYTL